MDDVIHQLSTKFLKSLTTNLGKSANKNVSGSGQDIFTDSSLQIIIHMISCTRSLRDAYETATGGAVDATNASSSNTSGPNSARKPKSSIYIQLFQPMLNGILALLGKMLMDSFTYEPRASDAAMFTAAYGILGRHILTLFPEMATKKHKTSGKMLIHHAVFKARPAIAEETVNMILKGTVRLVGSTFYFLMLTQLFLVWYSISYMRTIGGFRRSIAPALGDSQCRSGQRSHRRPAARLPRRTRSAGQQRVLAAALGGQSGPT
jgi:hypothetical protein